jgi:hypothetical protein
MRRFERRYLACAALFGSLSGCSGPSLEVLRAAPEEPPARVTPAASDYLSASGDGLFWKGAPLRFLGFNAFSLTGCGKADEQFDAAQIEAFFGSLRPRSVERTYAFSAQSVADIDAAIAVAAKHEQLLDLVLTDGNGSCGDGDVHKDDAWYSTGFRDQYLPWVREIVAHCKDQPNVGMWELVSSPEGVSVDVLRGFYDEVGAVVHQLSPHHLVSSGTHGAWAYGGAAGYLELHESPGIDVAGFREYSQDVGAPPNLAPALAALGGLKPLILAEAGIFASQAGDAAQMLDGRACISWQSRHDVLQTWIDEGFKTSLAGIAIWNYLPTANSTCEYSTYSADPLFGLVHDAPLP